MACVGIIVNPWAGKDIRRLSAPVGHTPDTAKIGIVQRAAIGALDAGSDRVLVARDLGRIAERAVADVPGAELIDGPGTGSPLDTQRVATEFARSDCDAVVVLGGDGTARDAAIGWRDIPMVAISTGTNNVFPVFVDGTSAGLAAGLVASNVVTLADGSTPAKILDVEVSGPGRDEPVRDLAVVDVALIAEADTGARAVLDPARIRSVITTIAEPATTGLSTIAARVHPLRRDDAGAVHVDVGPGARRVRVPIVPGSFEDLDIAAVAVIPGGVTVELPGPGVLAFDGERKVILRPDDTARVTVRTDGPRVIDVRTVLSLAVARGSFEQPACDTAGGDPLITTEAAHGN